MLCRGTRHFQELETAKRNLTEKQAHVSLVAQDVAVLKVSQLLSSTTTLQRKSTDRNVLCLTW